jgi:SWI/SNF related-matrix-associated actin-dependent regulator of chromatin subfamily C
VVAFLASVVDPEIAAKAASESVAELTQHLKKKAAAGDAAGNAAGDGKEQEDRNMAVDGVDEAAGEGKPAETSASAAEAETTKKNQMHRSATLALASAASKAHILAQQTSTELVSQIHQLVSMQVTKLNLKLQQFETLESSLDTERRYVEQSRQLLQQERLGVEKQLAAVAELSRKVAGGEQVPPEQIEQVRNIGMLSGSAGVYRSGMPSRVSQVQQGVNGPLNGAGAVFTSLD